MLRNFVIGSIFGLSVLSVFVYIFYNATSGRPFPDYKIYTVDDHIANYEKNAIAIDALSDFSQNIFPKNMKVSIAFQSGNVAHFNIQPMHEFGYMNSINVQNDDSIMALLNFGDGTLDSLRVLMNKANCIELVNSKQVLIGSKRIGYSLYSYRIFDKNLNDSLISDYNDGCEYIYYRANVVLEYGGGMFGPDCFPF